VDAWNSRDVEAALAYCCDDVVFTSPTAQRVVPDSGGVVRGKAALRDYWQRALGLHPSLHFTLVDVHAGVDTIVIRYRNEGGGHVAEVLTFDGGRISVGHATHRHEGDGSGE
jgi:ketosteroid isomerase-like protein